jgi:hypothetical protein
VEDSTDKKLLFSFFFFACAAGCGSDIAAHALTWDFQRFPAASRSPYAPPRLSASARLSSLTSQRLFYAFSERF